MGYTVIMGVVRRRFFRQYFIEIWLLVIAAIAITILVLSLFLYKSFESSTIDTIHRLNRDSLYETGRINEYVRKMIRTSGMELFSEPSIRRLLYGRDLSNFETLTGIRRIDSVRSMGRYIHSIYIYNAGIDYVYSSSETVSNHLHRFEDRGLLELLYQDDDYFGLIPIARYINAGRRSVPVHSFVFGATSSFAPEPRSLLVINVTLDWLDEIVHWGLSSLYMVDAEGRVLYHDDPRLFLADLSSELFIQEVLHSGSASGAFVANVSGERSLVLHAGSDGLFFIRVFPYAQVMADLRRMRLATLLSVLVVLIFGVLVAFILSRRLYQPIHRLVQAFGPAGPAGDATRDELGNLSMAIESMVARTTSLEESNRVRSRVLQVEVLKEFLQGETLGLPDAAALFREYDLPFTADQSFKLLVMRQSEPGKPQVADLLQAAFAGVPDIVACATSIGEQVAILIQDDGGRTLEDCLIPQLQAGSPGVIAMSDSIPVADEIPAAFAALRELVRFGFMSRPGELLLLTKRQAVSSSFEYPSAIEKRILQAAKAGDRQLAGMALQDFIKAAASYRYDLFRFSVRRLYVSVQALSHEAASLLACTGNASTESGKAPGKESGALGKESCALGKKPGALGKEPGALGKKPGFEALPAEPMTMAELTGPFRQLFDAICSAVESSRMARYQELACGIQRLIQEGYADPNLSLQGIADSLGFSVSHVSRFFKDATGLSVADAIIDFRLNVAKRLLLEGDAPIREIAQRVGLVNENYFYTLFRRKVGLTPAAFRRQGP
jgi:AraC-like DNA-binding protein